MRVACHCLLQWGRWLASSCPAASSRLRSCPPVMPHCPAHLHLPRRSSTWAPQRQSEHYWNGLLPSAASCLSTRNSGHFAACRQARLLPPLTLICTRASHPGAPAQPACNPVPCLFKAPCPPPLRCLITSPAAVLAPPPSCQPLLPPEGLRLQRAVTKAWAARGP